MGVYIKGMEMPTSCEDCPCAYFTEGVHHDFCQAVGYDSEIKRDSGWKLNNCPLIPVPPRGRLIDADALKNKHHWTDDFYETEYVEVEDIDDAPTIIPAEGE